jgi:5-methyltetrahydrofolate--homocysteine methyltransferase
MIVIGEKINGTRKSVAHAIQRRDQDLIAELALGQVRLGASYLDINAGTHPDREPADMQWLVETVQAVVDIPVCLDSANPQALEVCLRMVKQPPIINSLNGEQDRIDAVLPLAARYGARLIVLAMDDQGIPATAGDRMAIIAQLIGRCRDAGLHDEDLFIDPLVTTIATNTDSGQIAFETMRRIRQQFPLVHITCGLSNISFGEPSRTIINQAFAAVALACGLDSAIMDPEDQALRNVLYATELVLGRDPHCKRYNQAHRDLIIGTLPASDSPVVRALADLVTAMTRAGILAGAPRAASPQPAAPIAEAPIQPEPATTNKADLDHLVEALVAMRETEVEALTGKFLAAGGEPLQLLEASRKAMQRVGEKFERNEYFIPELMLAGVMLAQIAAQIKPHLQAGDAVNQKSDRVIIGTVKGDIHDIGKDIVVTMLEINGYEVLDLGVDVPVERFVEAAMQFKPDVIGLSGFLTLAYEPMKETIAALRAAGLDQVKMMIGGGQMDAQVARYVGADAFGKDAMEAVRLCGQWTGVKG